jgi:hypothetical protein
MPRAVPAKDQKGRPLCGLQIIGNLKPGSNGDLAGRLDLRSGQGRYLQRRDPDEGSRPVQVMGYMGVKFLSETHTWKRAPESFTVCSPARAS